MLFFSLAARFMFFMLMRYFVDSGVFVARILGGKKFAFWNGLAK